MSLNVPLLRTSFDLVVSREPEIAARFYEILFSKHPDARRLFGRSEKNVQERMLTEALVAVIEHLEDPGWLSENLGALGAKHKDYGVTDEMYNWVGESLLSTLREVARDAWSPELTAAWSEAYGTIAALMLQGARGNA